MRTKVTRYSFQRSDESCEWLSRTWFNNLVLTKTDRDQSVCDYLLSHRGWRKCSAVRYFCVLNYHRHQNSINLSHRQDSKDVHQTDVLNRERMDKTGPDRISIDKEYF